MERQTCNFPLFISLAGKPVVMYGGGSIARRRVETLLSFDASVRVIAPEATEELLALAAAGRLIYECRPFRPGEIAQSDVLPVLVLAATDDRQVNGQIVDECRIRHVPVNDAGDQSRCDFYFPAVVRADALVLGLTAGGTDHRKVRRVAAWLRSHIREIMEKSETQDAANASGNEERER